jgi:hypothetical protein
MVECATIYPCYDAWQFQRKYGYTPSDHVPRDLCDEGWDSKIGEDTSTKCVFSNAFNAIVETNRCLERRYEGIITNSPQRVGDVDICN